MFLNDINLYLSIAGKNKFLPFFRFTLLVLKSCGRKEK